MLSRVLKWFFIAIFLFGIFSILVYWFVDKRVIKTDNFGLSTIEFSLIKPKTKLFVVYNSATHSTWEVLNGVDVKLLSMFPQRPVKYLRLPKTSELFNVASTNQVAPLTWDVSLNISSEYVNYLVSQGYTVLMEVNATNFIEIYLVKGGMTKRLLIQPNLLISGDLNSSANLPSINSFLSELTF